MEGASDGTSDNEGGSDGIRDGEDDSDGVIEINFEGANEPKISCSSTVVTGTPNSIIFSFKVDFALFMTLTCAAMYLDTSISFALDAVNSYMILNVLPDCSCRPPVLLVFESSWPVTVALAPSMSESVKAISSISVSNASN